MKNKDLKNLIKSKADEIVVADRSSDILQKVKTSQISEYDAPKNRSKKLFYTKIVAVATVAVAIIIAIVLPFTFNQQGEGSDLGLTKTQQVLSKEVFALGNLLDQENELLSTVDDEVTGLAMDEIFSSVAKKINGYLLSAEAFLSSSNILGKYEDNKDEELADYAKKLTVSYTDSANYSVAYELYYNEAEQTNNSVTVDGMIKLKDRSYAVWGQWTNEHDEVSMELRVYFNEFKYISIEHETEINENEYEYGYYEYGYLTSGVSLSVSNENGIKKMEMEIVENGLETEVDFVFDKNVIHCLYENDFSKLEIDIRHDNNTYEYDFGFEFKISLNK